MEENRMENTLREKIRKHKGLIAVIIISVIIAIINLWLSLTFPPPAW